MSKKKNHTAHNQSRKDHRNGIHRLRKKPFEPLKGLYPKYLMNLRASRKWVNVPGGRKGYLEKKAQNLREAQAAKKAAAAGKEEDVSKNSTKAEAMTVD